ncbi:hypothetical protein [Nostoc sp. FACHB-145]|uniref:hypothetical protein n=1 Tax=Nostoc sp. FACHB-145 TaxID=2692836 RepID=UPI0016871934|nr:hypothetical protein [Nostoc sp. FACHB-145]MBD2472404.1 hypothetical protein [Nostoc sp. FACHB-145]
MSEESAEIVLIPSESTPSKIETSIAAFSEPLANFLKHLGLPTDNILSPIQERRKVIYNLESTLEVLPLEERAKSEYLSKFAASITMGLFDGALTFLWDETIKALGRLIVGFDLQYFYNVAGTISPKYKNLNLEEELEAISAHDLLEICRRMGLISDINFTRLEHVNYLRNHASAAHPNENDISGMEMISLLEYCLKYAITAKPDHSAIRIKLLLENIRKNEIPNEDFVLIGEDIVNQPQERIDDFLLSIFGIYCDQKQELHVKKNIEKLIPYVWNCALEETKYQIGSKFGWYRKNGDTARKNATQKILEIVNGLQYKDEDSLAAELIEKLQNLKTVHFEWNNYYNEYPHAKSISESIPKTGIPKSVRKLFVKVICICYCGNGKGYKRGVDERAISYYENFINSFTIEEVKEYLMLFSDNEFVYDLDTPKADERMRELANNLRSKTTNVHINKALHRITTVPRLTLTKITSDSCYKEAIKYI